MKKLTLICKCGKEVIYCPELKDSKTNRPVFECKNCGIHSFRNKDNFGFRK
jgi:hypothetical protein